MALPEAEVLVIGSGAGGGIAAWVLADAGYRVLVLEKGPWLDQRSFSNDDIKFGYRDFYTQDTLIEPRTFRVDPFRQAEVNHVSPLSRCVGGGSLSGEPVANSGGSDQIGASFARCSSVSMSSRTAAVTRWRCWSSTAALMPSRRR